MKYRVIYSIGYCTAAFQFDSIEVAGDFAKTMLMHQVPTEDTDRKRSVSVEVIDPNQEEEEEDDD